MLRSGLWDLKMISPYFEIAFLVIFAAAVFTAYVRDAYDQERWKTDEGYCRYGASLSEVLRWWWRKRIGASR